MTTIAWDGKTLAADSQATANDLVCSLNEQKIYTPGDGVTWKAACRLTPAVCKPKSLTPTRINQ